MSKLRYTGPAPTTSLTRAAIAAGVDSCTSIAEMTVTPLPSWRKRKGKKGAGREKERKRRKRKGEGEGVRGER